MAKGYTQREGLDYRETFSLMAKKFKVRTITSVATFFSWDLHQMDVSNALP